METSSKKNNIHQNNLNKLDENSENIFKLFEMIQKTCLKSSLYFDIHYKTVFKDFLAENQKIINDSSLYSTAISSKLKFSLKSKTYFKKHKSIFTKIVVKNAILPPKTKIYLPIRQNIRIEDIKSIPQIIGPSSLESSYSPKKLTLLKKSEIKIEKLVPSEKILKLKFLIKQIQVQFGFSAPQMKIAAMILQKDQILFEFFWKKIMQESKQNKIKEIQESYQNNKKIYAKKYANYFCTICMVYGCFHFVNINSKSEQSKYQSFFYIPENINTTIEIKWYLNFRCKNNNEDCFRYLKKNRAFNGDYATLEHKQFRKFERKLVDFCKDFKMLNPCLIYLMLKNGSSNKTCSDIKIYIEKTYSGNNLNVSLSTNNINLENEKENGESLPSKSKYSKRCKAKFVEYIPCFHKGECHSSLSCTCFSSNKKCEKFCSCFPACLNQYPGCSCLPGECTNNSKKCLCVQNFRECDPEICLSCCSYVDQLMIRQIKLNIPYCSNTSLLYNVKKRVLLGKSLVCEGLGIFAGEEFKKYDFIGEYTGDIISNDTREDIYSNAGIHYTFNLREFMILDAYSYGNKMRFLNHGITFLENARAKNLFVNGNHRIGFFAKTDIYVGEEILFNYGNEFIALWKKEFDHKIKKLKPNYNHLKKNHDDREIIEISDIEIEDDEE